MDTFSRQFKLLVRWLTTPITANVVLFALRRSHSYWHKNAKQPERCCSPKESYLYGNSEVAYQKKH